MNYTKGEWEITKFPPLDCYYICVNPTDLIDRIPIAMIEGKAQDLDTLANAHLIVAAPDMYEFCRELLMSIDTGYERLGAGREGSLRKLLAKVEGK